LTPTKTTAVARRAPASDHVEHLPDDVETGRTPGARLPVASEIVAAMAHELSGPITALLLYVGEIQQSTERGADEALKTVVEGACREAERIHAMVLKIGGSFESTAPEDSTISAARNAIAWWKRAAFVADEPRRESSDHPFIDCGRTAERSLTKREEQVLRLVIRGHSNKEGAALMNISYRTFESHRAEVMRKFGAKNAAELVRLVMQSASSAGTTLDEPTS
jgi:DNA-binding CsgD family transcriptional regulator